MVGRERVNGDFAVRASLEEDPVRERAGGFAIGGCEAAAASACGDDESAFRQRELHQVANSGSVLDAHSYLPLIRVDVRILAWDGGVHWKRRILPLKRARVPPLKLRLVHEVTTLHMPPEHLVRDLRDLPVFRA